MRSRSLSSRAFDLFNIVFLTFFAFITLYPMWNVLIVSLSNAKKTSINAIIWLPKFFTFDSYRVVFNNPLLTGGYRMTVSRTLCGVFLCLLLNSMVAYALSRKYFVLRKVLNSLVVVTMFLSGGLIPFYLVVNAFHMVNTFWGLVIPFSFDAFGLILIKNYFKSLPESLEESAKIDGAGDFRVFLRIFLPLSMPILATMSLFWAVYFWNDLIWSNFMVSSPNLQTLQAVLYKIIVQSTSQQMLAMSKGRGAGATTESIKSAAIIVTTVPILLVYPFLQRYFVKGVILGAVKE